MDKIKLNELFKEFLSEKLCNSVDKTDLIEIVVEIQFVKGVQEQLDKRVSNLENHQRWILGGIITIVFAFTGTIVTICLKLLP